ncbi:hypothetical protein [Bradyrhizobium genomosp. III]|uniref:hypothetical protein n=1 Tax=Bradyrhizobium genomosp. III TaxID=2683271 RepID=UPI0012F5009D|nr:hypothetical protein [Bradyrhizobium sp. CCBAU 15635]
MSEKEYTRVYTVQFVVSTDAKNEAEADERIDRIFSGTVTGDVADNNGLLDKIWGTFDGVSCEVQSSIGTPVVEISADDVGKALVEESLYSSPIDLPRILANAKKKRK